jgi:hypothetical protein
MEALERKQATEKLFEARAALPASSSVKPIQFTAAATKEGAVIPSVPKAQVVNPDSIELDEEGEDQEPEFQQRSVPKAIFERNIGSADKGEKVGALARMKRKLNE